MSYQPCEPLQDMQLPASLRDGLPKGYLAQFIGNAVDALDLRAFNARYAGGGSRNHPFRPAMMLKMRVKAHLVCNLARIARSRSPD